MIEHGFTRTSVITRLRRGPLGPHLDALATTLHQHGYAPDSIRRTLRAGEQFGQWLAQHGHAIADVDEALVARYIQTLPRPRVGRWPKAAAGLPHLLRLWRQQGLLPPRALPRLADGSGPMARALCAVPGARLWHGAQHPHRLSAHRHALADSPVWRRPRAVAHRVRPGPDGLCPARGRHQTWWGAQVAQCRRPLAPALPRVQWGTGPGLGSRRAYPTAVDPCPTPVPFDGRGGGAGPRHLYGRQSRGPAESRHPAAPGPPRRPGA